MPSSYSTDLKLELMVTGENAGTWGTKTNTNLNLLQQAIAGYQDISIAGGAQTTALTMDNATISNARNAVIKLTGTITGNQIVTVPNGIEKTYIVSNGTTGAFTVEFKTASGTGPTFSTTDKGIKILFTDGTNVIDVNANFSASSFPQINDSNGNEEIKFTTTASAVNEFTIANAATGNGPEISATGSDTNIDLKITPKGTGKINLDGIKFPNADGSAGQALVTNGSGVLSFASAGLTWQSVKTSNFTAVKGEAYPVDTTSSAITVTLPATPSAGDQVQVVDYAGTWDTNTLTINPNGNKILGQVSNVTATKDREAITLTYTDATQGWLPSSGYQESTQGLNVPYSVDFLVIAGGGGAGSGYGNGDGTGGGGAGGYRTSYSTSGGGSPAESKLEFSTGTVYTITVGGGGAGGTLNKGPNEGGQDGTTGTDSSITGSGFSTITSAGGGRGNRSGAGGNGGSGGGSSATGSGGLGTANQGTNGGAYPSSSPPFQAAGGGGSSAAGIGGTGSSPATGVGGAGTASTITGTSVTRAGGGGGARFNGTSSGTGGSGGGGAGGNGSPATNGGAGTVNTGSGGGGGGAPATGSTGANGGNGGTGVIILRMLTTNYSGVTTGSPTVTTSGADTIIVFNGSGSIRG